MITPVQANLWNPNPFPLGSAVEVLRQGDPRALIPCLKEHRSDYLPYYNSILDNPASKRNEWACANFAEAVVYASYRLLPEVVLKLLGFPLHLPVPIKVQIISSEPNRDVENVGENYPVRQFGFEEAIYIAINEGIKIPEKIVEVEQIVVAILDHSPRECPPNINPMDCFLHNSGPSDCETGYLDKSLKLAFRLGSTILIEALIRYIDKYGVSPEKEIISKFNELKASVNKKRKMLLLSDELRDTLVQNRYRFLSKENHRHLLYFAIQHRLDDLIPILLDPKRFEHWKPGKKEYIDCISQAVAHLSWNTILELKILLGDDLFNGYLEDYWNEESETPIITCLEAYLHYSQWPETPNPINILKMLFKFDEARHETDYKELKYLYMSIKDERKTKKYTHDEAVLKLIDEFRTIIISDSDSDRNDQGSESLSESD
jgi:hypothetical protein